MWLGYPVLHPNFLSEDLLVFVDRHEANEGPYQYISDMTKFRSLQRIRTELLFIL